MQKNQAPQTELDSPMFYVTSDRHVTGAKTEAPRMECLLVVVPEDHEVFPSFVPVNPVSDLTTHIQVETDMLDPNPKLKLTKTGAAVLGFMAGAIVATIITSYVMYIQINGL